MSGDIVVIGLSHHTAPIELREQLSVATEDVKTELHEMMNGGTISEGVLLSTCNRVELYAAAQDPVGALEAARRYLEVKANGTDLHAHLYERRGEKAAHHAFRVACSLDSMVVGEPQILGQIKDAFAAAQSSGAVGTLLNRCFNRAFSVAKRVRTETGIASGAVSVSSIAIELAGKIFGDLKGRHALLVGAGEMSEAAAKSLSNHGAQMRVLNRSPERAEKLAKQVDGQAVAFDELPTELTTADMVLTSTGSPKFTITRDTMKRVHKARRRRPLFIIDIAVPRDVDPRVGEMANVFLYDVDDLQAVAAENLTARKNEADSAERIVESEAHIFDEWRRSLTLTPTIVALRHHFRAIARKELERTLPRLHGTEERDAKTLEAMADAVVNKLLHQPLTELKRGANTAEASALIDATRRLFDLPEDEGEVAKATPSDIAALKAVGSGSGESG